VSAAVTRSATEDRHLISRLPVKGRMAGECACWNGSAWAGSCQDYTTCPPRGTGLDGAGLPLLPVLWGGLAADMGVYRSFPASALWRSEPPPSEIPRWHPSIFDGPTWMPTAAPY